MMDDTALKDQPGDGKSERACAWCGADISHRGPKAKFCSYVCKKRSYRHVNRHIDTKNCRMCGKEFDASGRKHKRVVCSDECWRAYDRLKHAMKSERPKTINGPMKPMECKNCGKLHINFNGRQGYCSEQCKSKAWRESETGKAYLSSEEFVEIQKKSYDRWRRSERGRVVRAAYSKLDYVKNKKREYEKTDKGNEVHRTSRRKRAAQAALATILLPTHQTKENDQ